MAVQSVQQIMSALRQSGIHGQIDVPETEVEPFYDAVERAVRFYLENPHQPKSDADAAQKVGKAALSRGPREMASAVAALSEELRGRVIELASHSLPQSPPTLEEVAAAAVRGSGRKPTARDIAKRQKPPPRTVGALPRGEPPMPNVDVLLSMLAAALAGATGKATTTGSPDYPSKLEELAAEVQRALGEVGHWNVSERVRRHVKERKRLEADGYHWNSPTPE